MTHPQAITAFGAFLSSANSKYHLQVCTSSSAARNQVGLPFDRRQNLTIDGTYKETLMDSVPTDILIPILRGLILQEEDEWFECTSDRAFHPRFHITLSLVCSQWRNIIATSPLLSPALIFDYAKNELELSRDIERNLDRIRGAPASIHLYNVHNRWKCTGMNGGLAKHDRKHCPSSHSSIAILLGRLSHIHRIHIHFVRKGGEGTHFVPFALTKSGHTLRRVKHFSVDLLDGRKGGNYTLMKQLKRLPNLTHLRVYGLTTCQIQFDAEHPNLLHLRSLCVYEPRGYVLRGHQNLFNLMSHAQNLEEMKVDAANGASAWRNEGFVMPHLRTVEVEDAHSLASLLLHRDTVQVPAIREFRYATCHDVFLSLLDRFAERNPRVCIIKLDR